jgi:hypothetical protein
MSDECKTLTFTNNPKFAAFEFGITKVVKSVSL